VSDPVIAEIARAISAASGKTFHPVRQHAVSGGCINQSLSLHGQDGRRFFIKINQAAQLETFAAETAGLMELHAARAIRVPQPLTHGLAGGQSFLAMEWLDLSRGAEHGGARLGEQLARLHARTWHAFGWWRDNNIGGTHQANPATPDWVAFYRDQRLRPQLELAAQHGAAKDLIDGGERLLAELAAFFPGYTPRASLLHGDLWSGNAGVAEGVPVLFDPAVYYGDRETDIAMTELFGGFTTAFHAAYNAAWPLDPGYATRRLLYQLYHLLNHFNLFGDPYARQSRQAIEHLLAELR